MTPVCCRIGCNAPAVISIHETAPGARPCDYTEACARHVDTLEGAFQKPRRYALRDGLDWRADGVLCGHTAERPVVGCCYP